MSDHRIRPSLSSRPVPPSPKLKDSCDRCSSSKVRCTKGKPSCARCDKLGYTCFYSPARRVGRPYRPKGSISEENPTDKSHQRKNTPTTTCFIDESVKLYSRLCTSSTPVEVNPDSSPSISPINQPDTSSTARPPLEAPSSHDNSDPDCVLVALDLISLLEVSATQLRGSNPIDDILLSATAQAIGGAIDRLCTILACSCSGQAEVGMLVSAICMSIIDIHTVSIAMLRRDYSHDAVLGLITPWDTPSIESESETEACLVLGELSEVAKVILQIFEGYNHWNGTNGFSNGSELPVGILTSLATSLRGRLQQITMTQVGPRVA